MITREMTVPVAFACWPGPASRPEDVRRVATHPHAAAQCRRWCALHLPDAEVVHTSSTAHAALMLTRPDADWDAAISAPIAAEHYRLATLATAIGDNPDAVTRFVLVSRPGPPPPPTGRDKTSIVAFMRDDHPGALLEILDQLAMRGRQPDPDRVPADRRRARQLLLLHRLRGARRRRPGRGGADGAAPGLRGRPVPRVLRAARRSRAGHPGRHVGPRVPRRRRLARAPPPRSLTGYLGSAAMNDSLVSTLVVLLLLVSVAALAVAVVALRRTTVDARRISRRNPATVPTDLEGLRGEVQALRVGEQRRAAAPRGGPLRRVRRHGRPALRGRWRCSTTAATASC